MAKNYIHIFGKAFPCEDYHITRWGDSLFSLRMPPRQIRINFENGYTLSIIADGYGASEGLYEAALIDRKTNEVIPGLSEDQYDDVVGYLSHQDVTEMIQKVMDWPRKEDYKAE